MCHVHIIKKLPSAQRKKYLPVAQVVPCQDKPKGISLWYSNFVWNLTWTFQQRVLAKLKILLLSKTEVPPERKTIHPAMARATQAQSLQHMEQLPGSTGRWTHPWGEAPRLSCHSQLQHNWLSLCQCSGHCLHIPSPALGHRGCHSDYTVKFGKSLFS